MNTLFTDLRIGIRTLAVQRHFTTVAVIVLALGIGVTTAVFSVVNAVLLRPLPYADPDRLVAITSVYTAGAVSRPSRAVTLTDVAEWRTRTATISAMGAFAYTQLPLRVGDRSFSPVTALTDAAFLPVLGNPLARGTFFDAGAAPGVDRTAIISHALWTEAFGADAGVVGRAIAIDGEPYVVRGVLAPDFQFPRSDASYYTTPVELLIPASTYPNFPATARQWFGIARLGPGATGAAAEAELRSVAERLSRDEATGGVWSVRLAPLAEETTRRAREPLLVVLGISIVLLLIASTNLMNLFFARGVSRLREMSVRRAIGATTGQLLRLMAIESLLIAAAGGAAGVWLAALGVNALVVLSPVHLPVTGAIGIDASVLIFTAAICLGAALAAGFLPALQVSARSTEAVRSPGMRASASRGVARMQEALCVAQVALGVALLAAAGLLATSLWRLGRVDPGFDSARVLGFNLSVPNDVPLDQRRRFYARALEEVRTIPGVERAGLISFLPPETRAGVFMGLAIEGMPPPERGAPARVINTLISGEDYFTTVGMSFARGRDFRRDDTVDSQPVIVVNEAFVRQYFPAGDAEGRRIGTGFDGMQPVRTIIGVVKDTHDRGLAREPVPTVYIPFTQFALPYGSIALRTAVAPEAIIPTIRERLTRLNPAVPLTGFETIERRIHESIREPRFYTLMAAACAALAVIFVTFGLYGLVSYSVSRRIPELGIRIAIGAQRTRIVGMVLGQALRMGAAGALLGLALAAAFSRVLESLLFEVRPLDPATFAASAAVVLMVTLAASYAPARRASRVSPISVLRYE